MTPLRFIVHHLHQAYPGAPVEDAWVSYNTALNYGLKRDMAYSYAVHTACRYGGEIFSQQTEGGELKSIKAYRSHIKMEKKAENAED